MMMEIGILDALTETNHKEIFSEQRRCLF